MSAEWPGTASGAPIASVFDLPQSVHNVGVIGRRVADQRMAVLRAADWETGKRQGMVKRAVVAAILMAGLLLSAAVVRAETFDVAVFQGLDKVTARVTTIEAPVGEVVRFGTLEIIARTCEKRPPEEPPESASFLDIWEVRPGEPAVSIFRGWMFASSPALSAMEHPVYDVWVLDCHKTAPSAEPASSSDKSP
jgi:hypothetical protein